MYLSKEGRASAGNYFYAAGKNTEPISDPFPGRSHPGNGGDNGDEGIKPTTSFVTESALTGLTQALLMYNGEAFTPTSDLFIILIAGPDYDLDVNFGQSDALMISVNVTPGSSTGIPSGTYTIIDAEQADDYPVGTALNGVYNTTYGGYFGSWFYSTRNKLESSVRGGKVVITNNGQDSYKFDIQFEDGYGHKITGTYSGKCRVEDWS